MKKNPPNKQPIGLNRRRARKIKQREVSAQQQVITAQKRKKTALIHEMHRTIRQHVPDLLDWMRQLDDCRHKASDHELAAHRSACLVMFLFKVGSCNQYNPECHILRKWGV